MLDLLIAPTLPETPAAFGQWFDGFKRLRSAHPDSVDRATLGGRASSSVGFAFASGYQSAIEHLFQAHMDPENPALASLCVSETTGNHPRAIETTLTQKDGAWRLHGEKSFVSGALDAARLFVACKTGTDQEGQPMIKVVRVDCNQPGVQITPLPALPFVPEVSHGRVKLDQVMISAQHILPGDGYLGYVKPFRTCEDIHVCAGVLGYLIGEAVKSGWPESLLERMLALVLCFQQLAKQPLDSASNHIALAGARQQLDALIESCSEAFRSQSPEAFKLWQRDRALLNIAQKAHGARTEKAWQRYR